MKDQFKRACRDLGGRLKEPNPKVHVCEVGHGLEKTELIFHEDTGGGMMVYYEGEFGKEANFETNFNNLEVEDGEGTLSSVDGHFTPEGGHTQHRGNVDVTITRDGNLSASTEVF